MARHGGRHAALHQMQFLQPLEVTSAGVGTLQAGGLGDALDGVIPSPDGVQDGDVVARLAHLVADEREWFQAEHPGAVENLNLHVGLDRLMVVEALQVGGDAAQDSMGGDSLGGRVAGEELGQCTKGQRLYRQLGGEAPVQR